jgi:hypothetical protein
MRRIIGLAIILGLAFGGVAFADSDQARHRGPSRANPRPLTGVQVNRDEARRAVHAILRDQVPRVAWFGGCRTLRCLNKRLNLLKAAVNKATAHVNALDSCLGIQGMTSYGEDPNGGNFGYVWRDNTVPTEFLTTGLDYDTFDQADVWTVVWLCA